MKKGLFLLLISTNLMASDTYLFRVKVDQINSKTAIESTFLPKGVRGSAQPFYGTYVLSQADTNYVLLKMTPSSESEFTEMKQNFSNPNIDLYQIYTLDDSGVRLTKDNSKQFPVNKNWAEVTVSSK